MKAGRNLIVILAALSCCFLVSCHHVSNDLYKRFSLTYYRNGRLWSGILKEPATIQSYPCVGRVSFDSTGRINHFRLSRDFRIRGHEIPENSIVDDYGKIMQILLPHSVEIQGYMIPGGEYVYTPFTLDRYGNLIFFLPEEDIEVNGIPCMGGYRTVQLYPDGRLWVCTLARDMESNGIVYPQETQVLFDEYGTMQEYSFELYNQIREDLDL